MKYIILSYCLALIGLVGCECVTAIDTPKEVNPTFFAHVLFINGHPDMDEINIKSDNTVLVKSLYYNTNPKNYADLSPGSRNILITSPEDSILFNSSLDLTDKQNYTFIAYGTENRLQTLFFNDTISDYSVNNTYFRFVDIAPESPPFIIRISNQYPIVNLLHYRSFTKYVPTTEGKYELEMRQAMNDSLVLSMKDINMKAGKIYTILIKGYNEGIGSKKLQFQIIENTFIK